MSKITIGLLWHNFNSGNLGVGALSIANASLVVNAAREKYQEVELVVLGFKSLDGINNIDDAQKLLGCNIEQVEFNLRSVLKGNFIGFSAVKKCDIIFDIGEGDSFSDIYGLPRLLNQAFTKVIAQKLSGRLYLSPQTYGPFKSKIGKLIFRYITHISSAVFSRDYDSKYACESISSTSIKPFTDVAFLLPFDRQVKTEKNSVGINVSGLLFNKGYSGKDEFGMSLDYKKLTKELIEYFIIHKVEVHLISHVTGGIKEEDDFLACEELNTLYPATILAPRFTNPVEAKSYISSLHFFIGGRMHATIGAFSSGVPVVPIAYSMKFAGVFGLLNYKCLVDGRVMSSDDAKEYIISNYLDRDKIKIDVDSGLEVASSQLEKYKKELKEVICGR